MKQPLWILNSALLIVLLFCFLFVALYKIHIPKKESLIPTVQTEQTTSKDFSIDVSKIYLNDLFNTYQTPPPEQKPTEKASPMPQPPTQVMPSIPQDDMPKFLDPLAITLSGAITFTDETKNRAIILLNKSNQEKIFKVGDEIEDAQILKIYKNRVVLIRANGQQETIYLTESEVNKSLTPWLQKTWTHVIQKTSPFNYFVDPHEFKKEIKNISQLIDLLDLTTIYKQGIPIGCKIGLLSLGSLVGALGLQAGDAIFTINNIPAATIRDRSAIYEKISSLTYGDTITIDMQRKNSPAKLTITLKSLRPEKNTPTLSTEAITEATTDQSKNKSDQEMEEKIDILKRSKTFAPTYHELSQQETKNMLGIDDENVHEPREINAEVSHETNS
jgi:type II secretion system protein C